ncbi:aKG-HExxH-type peptide beta-hydroxylase [Spirosoma areae]
MKIRTHSLDYLNNDPFIICEPALAQSLAQAGWNKLAKETGVSTDTYCIANCLSNSGQTINNQQRIEVKGTEGVIIEVPDFNNLRHFYKEHGLDPLATAELEAKHVQEKLQRALALLETVEPVTACIGTLVRTLQVLRQEDFEVDTSYSHPKIPFSVFVSVCEDASLLSSLRVAESILHEVMHLQLTLLEDEIELIRPESNNLYFSPWRDEDRPARGILHGLYVFRAVHDFYVSFAATQNYSEEVKDFLLYRIESIESELNSLSYFNRIPDLTHNGRLLVCQIFKLRMDVIYP